MLNGCSSLEAKNISNSFAGGKGHVNLFYLEKVRKEGENFIVLANAPLTTKGKTKGVEWIGENNYVNKTPTYFMVEEKKFYESIIYINNEKNFEKYNSTVFNGVKKATN
jgi:hypothetical protein